MSEESALGALLEAPVPFQEQLQHIRHSIRDPLERLKELFNLGLRGGALVHEMRPVGVFWPIASIVRHLRYDGPRGELVPLSAALDVERA